MIVHRNRAQIHGAGLASHFNNLDALNRLLHELKVRHDIELLSFLVEMLLSPCRVDDVLGDSGVEAAEQQSVYHKHHAAVDRQLRALLPRLDAHLGFPHHGIGLLDSFDGPLSESQNMLQTCDLRVCSVHVVRPAQ